MNNASKAKTESKFADNIIALDDLKLLPHEKLQLHMDCVNALGEIVGVEDVDDMGGVVRNLPLRLLSS